ncbi:MAG: hypothetical protein NTX26_00880 [Candidatus Parcubacteria bacterium]|nr:hypothetical protein [Candidatus Parcubacteria bacterium]
MAINIDRKNNEPLSTYVYRAMQTLKKSNLVREVKKNRYHKSKESPLSIHNSAIYKQKKTAQINRKKVLGLPFKTKRKHR